MSMNPVLRSSLWLAFFGLVLIAWWMMYAMAMQMDLDWLGRPGEMGARMAAMDPRMPMYMPMANFGPLFVMWAAMMAAMMLPTLVPTLRSYEDLMVSADGSRAGWLGVIAGYFLVWVLFAAVIAGVQMALLYGGVIDMLGIPKSRWVAAAILLAVGLFQFTRAKEICHGVCHSPMMYFLGHWRTGFAGGLRMGLGLGAFCVGCCWGFMVLGFVGGVMNLAWMGLATVFMVVEKLPQIGHYVTKPMGFALILGAVVVAGWPLIAGG
jgi:predicted metal-binding membrane protein